MRQLNPETVKRDCEEKLRAISDFVDNLKEDLRDMMRVEIVKDAICNKEMKMGHMIDWRGMSAERDIAFMNCCCQEKSRYVILPTSLLLCSLDKMQSIFFLKLYWKIADMMGKYAGRNIFDRGCEILDYLTELRGRLGQPFFKLMNLWEPVLIGHVIVMGGDVGKQDLRDNELSVIEGIQDLTGVQVDLSFMLPTSESRVDVLMALELVGLCKSFGYPTLSSSTIFDKFREFGVNENMVFDDKIINDVLGIMKRDLMLNYYKKNCKYLALKYCPPRLLNVIRTNRVVKDEHLRNYTMWAHN